jgi:hypothetical protein
VHLAQIEETFIGGARRPLPVGLNKFIFDCPFLRLSDGWE